MKVAMLEAAHRLVLRQVPIPAVRPGCVLIRIAACGICGTDVALFEGRLPVILPYSLGHEYVGTVVEVGRDVRGFAPGDRVAVNPNAYCGVCSFCRRGQVHLCKNRSTSRFKSNGGLAEYTVVSDNIVHHLPETLPFPEAAFAEPLSCALHALDRVRFLPGDRALVLGAGTMGLLMLQLLLNAGAPGVAVSEPMAVRREHAARLKADLVLDPLGENVAAKVRPFAPDGLQLVVECSGNSDAAVLGLTLLERGGTLLLVGLGAPREEIAVRPNDLVERELAIVGTVLNPFSFARAIELLHAGRLQVRELITPFSLDQVVDAITAAQTGNTVKSMVLNAD